jgi:hypothetical protein
VFLYPDRNLSHALARAWFPAVETMGPFFGRRFHSRSHVRRPRNGDWRQAVGTVHACPCGFSGPPSHCDDSADRSRWSRQERKRSGLSESG